MAEFSDKIQALMDETYNEWRKDENRDKSKWDVLGDFSVSHQVAVTFGNFNYQVENGGIEQWIYNGYCQDDAEKFIEFLEIGAETDDRCRNILDKVYQLDQYAHETDCDRYGNFTDLDGEDGESGFIGDIINCDKFDSWYYDNCGKEDWWSTVCGIMDKAEARLALTEEHEYAAAEIQPEKESVLDKIHEAMAQPKQPHKPKSPDKSEPEL